MPARRSLSEIALPRTPSASLDAATSDLALNLPAGYGQSLNLLQRYDTLHGLHNYKGTNTRRCDHGLGVAQSGGDSIQAFIGDSLFAGSNSGVGSLPVYDRLNAFPFALANSLAVSGIRRNGTMVRFTDSQAAQPSIPLDPRLTATGTWVSFNSITVSNAVNSTFTFKPEAGVDANMIRVQFLMTGAGGVFTISLDGTVIATISPTNSTAMQEARVNLQNAANKVIGGKSAIKITVTTQPTGGIGLSFMECWSPNGGLRILNFGQSGARIGATGSGNLNWSDFTVGTDSLGRVYKDGLGKATTYTGVASTTAASTTLTVTGASFPADTGTASWGLPNTLVEGEPLDEIPGAAGKLFPENTYVVARLSATTLQMSQAALITASSQSVRIGREPDAVHIEGGLNDMQVPYTAAQIAAGYTAQKTQYGSTPTYIYHLVHEISTVSVSGATQLAYRQALMQQAETDDVAIYDWYDRVGPFATGQAAGDYGDNLAHLRVGVYMNLAASLASAIGPGSGMQQNRNLPVFGTDAVNKQSLDDISRFNPASIADGTQLSGTTETIKRTFSVPANFWTVGKTVVVSQDGSITGTSVTVLARIREGTAGTTSDTALAATAASAALATGAAWWLEAELTCRAVGSSGSIQCLLKFQGDNIAPRVAKGVATVNTTVDGFITVAFTLAGTSPTLTESSANIVPRQRGN